MVKVKRRTKKENTVQNKDNKVTKKCVVKLKRLNNKSARKIDKTPLNATQEESTSALNEQSTSSEVIFPAESTEIESCKLKNRVGRMKNLPETAISLRAKEVLKPPQVENLSINPKPASKSPLEMVLEENFKTPIKKPRKVQLNVSIKKTKTSQKIENETNEKDVYEFSSQSSISEKEDPTADVVQKLIKTGRASVAKHFKGKGRPKASRKRAAPKILTRNIKKNKNEIPQENPVKPRAKELPKQAQIDVDTSSPIAYPVEKSVVNESDKPQQRTPVTDKRKLLEVARNFVKQSTPIRKQNVGPIDSPYSPIAMKSPWRPLEEEHLPRTFYFSRNEDDLPSFSSDFIPSSQVAERSRRSILNHSDIENVNPDNEAVANNNNNNPRKTLGPRSPLKSINILEIINLPRKSVSDKSLIKPLLCNKLLPTTSKSSLKLRDETQQSYNIDPENFSIDNCFGFDECIEDQDEETTPKIVPDKSRLMERLKNLQRLCPKTTPRRPQEKARTIYPKVSKQKDIRDVLTSTFQENESGTSTSNINFNNSADISVIPEEGSQINSSIHLFDDADDPTTSSDAPALTRTYIRYPKKRRHSLDYSDEEEEAEVEEQKVKKPKQTKATDAKLDKELDKFAEEFNSMCEEVNQYKLLIVKE